MKYFRLKLYVDSSNNRVGIDRVPTESDLELSGTGTIGIGTNVKFQGGTSGIGNSSSLTLLLDGTNRDFYINTRGNGSGEGTSGVQERFRIGTNGAIFSNIKTISGSVESTGSFGYGVIADKLEVNGSQGFTIGNAAGKNRIKTGGSGDNIFQFLKANNSYAGIEAKTLTITGGGTSTFAGHVSGSSTSTGSFGRIQASTIGGNSPLTIEADNFSVDSDGTVSGSGASTGSFGRLRVGKAVFGGSINVNGVVDTTFVKASNNIETTIM